MGDIALKGNKLTKKDVRKHYEEVKAAFPEDFKRKKPARTRKMGGGRTNLLEELGRVEGERSNPNRRAEISRVHGELNRGYAKGGRIGLKHGGPPTRANKRLGIPGALGRGKVPTKEALQRMLARRRDFQTHGKDVPTMAAKGGRMGFKKGGSDKNWIQKAVNPKHKGYCTPMTKKTCTPARKALARTFKKKAKTGW